MSKRKVCVVTGTRAEYGLLYWLMKEIQQDDELELQLVVTGMHLSPEFGLTYKQIELDGFVIDEKVEMLLSADSPSSISKSIGLGTIGFADIFSRLKPDLIVLLGDRFETFAAAQTAMIQRIPIAHIHGGELTEGLIDDPIRHSITKMAHLHFTAAEPYRQRIIQMGEQPNRVFNVGAPGIDGIKKLSLMDKEELSNSIDFNVDYFFLITLHPITLENQTSLYYVENLLNALDKFPDYQLVFTKTNADTEGRVINEKIEEYVRNKPNSSRLYDSLGQVRYLSSLNHCSAVIGNSSSGLIEAPVFSKPTVNIGDRQRGRLKAKSVIDCGGQSLEIEQAISRALSPEFQTVIQKMNLPYGSGNTTEKIIDIIKSTNLKDIIKKEFYDIEVIR